MEPLGAMPVWIRELLVLQLPCVDGRPMYSKSRLAYFKTLTIRKLELAGYELLARIMSEVFNLCAFRGKNLCLCDLVFTLSWIPVCPKFRVWLTPCAMCLESAGLSVLRSSSEIQENLPPAVMWHKHKIELPMGITRVCVNDRSTPIDYRICSACLVTSKNLKI